MSRPARGAEESFGTSIEGLVSILAPPIAVPIDAPRSGSRIADRFEVEQQLAAGGMGVVVLARDLRLGRRVAIKLCRLAARDASARLLREARALARVEHPSIVHIFAVGEHEGSVFIAMEYVPGGTLRTWSATPRPWSEVLHKFVLAGAGLAAAHAAGLVHRDFKPDNVLLGDDGRPRVADFGLVLELAPGVESVRVTETGVVYGTPAYIAPEQLAGQADARTDQFAFCVALWEALDGRLPFAAASLPQRLLEIAEARVQIPRAREVPTHVWTALRKGLAADPRDRHANMDALLRALTVRRGRALPWVLSAAAGMGSAIVLVSRRVPLVLPAIAVDAPPAPDPMPDLIARGQAARALVLRDPLRAEPELLAVVDAITRARGASALELIQPLGTLAEAQERNERYLEQHATLVRLLVVLCQHRAVDDPDVEIVRRDIHLAEIEMRIRG